MDNKIVMEKDNVEKMLLKLPIYVCMEWCEYKGEVVVAHVNYEASKKAKKPMVDISYCMTKALNNNILKTVQFDKNKFNPTKSRN